MSNKIYMIKQEGVFHSLPDENRDGYYERVACDRDV